MLLHPRSTHRPYHLGPRPLEALPRIRSSEAATAAGMALPRHCLADQPTATTFAAIAEQYRLRYADLRDGPVAPARAPVPEDTGLRTADIRGLAYFLDVDQVGIAREPEAGRWQIVLLVALGREPESDNLASEWLQCGLPAAARLRAEEIAVVIAGYIRALGWPAEALLPHAGNSSQCAAAAVSAGLLVSADGVLRNPFLGTDYALAIVTTDYPLSTDLPLSPRALSKASGLRFWWGVNGARSGREERRRRRRRSDLSRYPMETVRRVDRPTTLILDDEVPRVPKRASFFTRALHGDLGDKAQRERGNFATKHPTARAMGPLFQSLVPHQDGDTAPDRNNALTDPESNARAVKSMAYALGVDLVGICEVPRYAWYSHQTDGTPIEPRHRYAIVMLIDQGFDTMEGASGDDWISGAQSMRAYLRGAEVAGVMAAFLRSQGYSSRAQTNADSDVLQIPLVLLAGLGELSRIGELVLNPFVGPRFKSVVLTTDLPLECDQPIDFGLQTFCRNCLKCARECPCNAISWGDSVMYNGYEMWKLDVERCTRYRLTNARGSACGRCMKTCPINKVVDADGALLTRAASWLGVNLRWGKRWLVPFAAWFDDAIGNGRRNPVKKWWLDLEIVDGVAVKPRGVNERELDLDHYQAPEQQKIAYYNADTNPPPDAAEPVPLDRKAALIAATLIETPDEARARRARGEPAPAHYRAVNDTSV